MIGMFTSFRITNEARNLYDPENAWTDTSGALHMQIKKKSDRRSWQKYS